MPTTSRDLWTIVVPLKSSRRGKSRIEVDSALRRRLALAMALDTVTAAAAADGVGSVLVVVDDLEDGGGLTGIPGVRILRTRTTDLNLAIGDGLAAVWGDARADGGPGRRSAGGSSATQAIGAGGPVAVLPADLPSLTPAELAGALVAAGPHPLAVVADRQGTGSTLLAAAAVELLVPRYGSNSLHQHVAAGAVPLDLPVASGLRRDVDQVEDLMEVTGPHTVAALEQAGWAPVPCAARRAV